jgi:hypothetical protein
MVKIDPDTQKRAPGHCLATVFSIKNGKANQVWSRYLINNTAPVTVYVSDSNGTLITMDEWATPSALQVAVYGPGGFLQNVYDWKTMKTDKDIVFIPMTTARFGWNDGAISFFGPEDDSFVILEPWGRLIILDFISNNCFPDPWSAPQR